MAKMLNIINRDSTLLDQDLDNVSADLGRIIKKSKFLVIGGGGSIGQAVVKQIFKRNPMVLHVVDINENSVVELVRDIRSEFGYIDGDFQTFTIDACSIEFQALMNGSYKYDYVFNLSALKHVRNEKDPYTLMRMLMTNIIVSKNIMKIISERDAKKYFCVSTDKAANPANLMGASKKIMEMFLVQQSQDCELSMARFANVAFSDGSLLQGFRQRFEKGQPITAPNDVERFFMLPSEAGELCLMACIFGENRDIFFPKPNKDLRLTKFTTIAKNFLKMQGYDVKLCSTEEEARSACAQIGATKEWPCFFFPSDTTGEKPFEEFYTNNEEIDWSRFTSIGIIKNTYVGAFTDLEEFERKLVTLRSVGNWSKQELIELVKSVLPEFEHYEKSKSLEQRM